MSHLSIESEPHWDGSNFRASSIFVRGHSVRALVRSPQQDSTLQYLNFAATCGISGARPCQRTSYPAPLRFRELKYVYLLLTMIISLLNLHIEGDHVWCMYRALSACIFGNDLFVDLIVMDAKCRFVCPPPPVSRTAVWDFLNKEPILLKK